MLFSIGFCFWSLCYFKPLLRIYVGEHPCPFYNRKNDKKSAFTLSPAKLHFFCLTAKLYHQLIRSSFISSTGRRRISRCLEQKASKHRNHRKQKRQSQHIIIFPALPLFSANECCEYPKLYLLLQCERVMALSFKQKQLSRSVKT